MIGQPKSYSGILTRVFWASVLSGIGSIYLLSDAVPQVSQFIDSLPKKVDFGILKDIKVLTVLIPLAIALLSRIIRLHNLLSTILRIRKCFDTKYLLQPLALGCKIDLDNIKLKKISKNRKKLMDETFYKYAGFEKSIIDTQLARTAADNWGWFWSLLESAFLFAVSTIILAMFERWRFALWCLAVVLVEIGLLWLMWSSCKSHGKRQVDAILDESSRLKAISRTFKRFCR
jgi:hypothetical protein